MSIILDTTAGNYTAWREAINEQASRLKYGQHAVHLTASMDAPQFRDRPTPDDIDTSGYYSYEHVVHNVNNADVEAVAAAAEALATRHCSSARRFTGPINYLRANLFSILEMMNT